MSVDRRQDSRNMAADRNIFRDGGLLVNMVEYKYVHGL
jgi:hypothetical protein